MEQSADIIVENANDHVMLDSINIDTFVYHTLSGDGELPIFQAIYFAEPLVLLLNNDTSGDLLGDTFGQQLFSLIEQAEMGMHLKCNHIVGQLHGIFQRFINHIRKTAFEFSHLITP
jgi:hypothetical protein